MSEPQSDDNNDASAVEDLFTSTPIDFNEWPDYPDTGLPGEGAGDVGLEDGQVAMQSTGSQPEQETGTAEQTGEIANENIFDRTDEQWQELLNTLDTTTAPTNTAPTNSTPADFAVADTSPADTAPAGPILADATLAGPNLGLPGPTQAQNPPATQTEVPDPQAGVNPFDVHISPPNVPLDVSLLNSPIPMAQPANAPLPPTMQADGPAAQPQPWFPKRTPRHMDLRPWGSIFTYRGMELKPGLCFTAPELEIYLEHHPQSERLRLLIQNAPFALADRYPDPLSSRCRFVGCPTRGNYIRPGQFRVALDEQPFLPQSTHYNPHIYAGFVHLWCLERFLDFPKLCKNILVQVDGRPETAPGVPNLMRAGSRNCAELARKFVHLCRTGPVPRLEQFDYPKHSLGDNWYYEATLCYRLGRTFCRDIHPWYADRLMPYFGDLRLLPVERVKGLHGAH